MWDQVEWLDDIASCGQSVVVRVPGGASGWPRRLAVHSGSQAAHRRTAESRSLVRLLGKRWRRVLHLPQIRSGMGTDADDRVNAVVGREAVIGME